jgi:hypothetical protein
MMHPDITRELLRAQQQDTLERITRETAWRPQNPQRGPARQRHRRRRAYATLRTVAGLEPRGQ